MSVIDSLIRGMKYNPDDDDDDMDDDDMDDGVYDDEEDQPKRKPLSFRRNRQRDDDEDDYEETAPQPVRQPRPVQQTRPAAAPRQAPAQMPQRRQQQRPASNMQVRIIKPSSFDQARQITETLLTHRTVLLNLEGLDVNTAQRIVDFASGSCYALHGNFMKISHFIIVITPEEVDIAGDIDLGAQGDTSSGAGMAAAQAAAAQQTGPVSYNTQQYNTVQYNMQ